MVDSASTDVSELSEDKQRIVAYLHEKLSKGEPYIRSKDIAESLGLSSKQVGAHLGHLQNTLDNEPLSVDKWGRHRSTTWYIEQSDG